MTKVNLILAPQEIDNKNIILAKIAEKTRIPLDDIKNFRFIRKSIDARKTVKFNVDVEFILTNEIFDDHSYSFDFKEITSSKHIIIVGAGPAGYFAALECLLLGIKPIILERGKSIDDRKFDIANLNKNHILNPESNYLFGEGGAGTYSDGKLFTRSKKRGDNSKILQLLHLFGANENILFEAHPHIGTDKLPQIMKNIRKKIIDCGGEIYFNTKLTSLVINNNSITAVKTDKGDTFNTNFVVLATGHSARDVFYLLNNQGIILRNKSFAMGVRVEHPQELINSIQYKKSKNNNLPSASYSLVNQVDERGVYSFCMCPGGIIVNSSTENNQIVVNGMSNSYRNSSYANSGIVVEIRDKDMINYSNNLIFSGLEMQRGLEELAFLNSASGLKAPAQRLPDFVRGKISANLPECSYISGIISSPLHFWLPDFIAQRLQKAFKMFDKKMHGFLTNDAIAVGVETRTSSPIKILRNDDFCSVSIDGLYPCGEGAGYAGGIVSSAIDGQNAVQKIFQKMY
jgi:uncharacterized FAD-dependent dehydrogenase